MDGNIKSAFLSHNQDLMQPNTGCKKEEAKGGVQLWCPMKKSIPCHRCGSDMKFFMRRVKYLDTIKEYPAYRCMKKKCQTFRSPRTLARAYNYLMQQEQLKIEGKMNNWEMNISNRNATYQLKEAFPECFNTSNDAFKVAPIKIMKEELASSSVTKSKCAPVDLERQLFSTISTAKLSLSAILKNGGQVSKRLQSSISELCSLASSRFELADNGVFYDCAKNSDKMNIDENKAEFQEQTCKITPDSTSELGNSPFHQSDYSRSVRCGEKLRKYPNRPFLTRPYSRLQPSCSWVKVSKHSSSFKVQFVGDDSQSEVTTTNRIKQFKDKGCDIRTRSKNAVRRETKNDMNTTNHNGYPSSVQCRYENALNNKSSTSTNLLQENALSYHMDQPTINGDCFMNSFPNQSESQVINEADSFFENQILNEFFIMPQSKSETRSGFDSSPTLACNEFRNINSPECAQIWDLDTSTVNKVASANFLEKEFFLMSQIS